MKKITLLFFLGAMFIAQVGIAQNFTLSGNSIDQEIIQDDLKQSTLLPGQATQIANGDLNSSRMPVTITHSATQNIVGGNSVTCNAGGLQTDNSFFRVFDLATDFGIAGPFEVTDMEFAVETTSGPYSFTGNIYSFTGTFPVDYPANAVLQGTGTFTIDVGDSGTVVTTSVDATTIIPAGEILIYEVFFPETQTTGTPSTFPGSNADGQTDASYIAAAACGINNPIDLTAIGFPNMHLVMNIVSNPMVDPDAPIISCPMVAPVPNDAGECGAIVNFSDAVAIDPNGGTVTVTQTMGPASGTLFPVGDTTVEFTATNDDAPNEVTVCSFVVTVNDVEDAMITCPDDITVDQDMGTCGAVVNYMSPEVVDNCPTGGSTMSGTFTDVIRITEPGLATTGNLFSFAGTPTGATSATLTVRVFGDIDGVAGGGNDEFWTIFDEGANEVGTAGGTGDFADQCTNEITEVFTLDTAMVDTWAGDGMIDFTVDDVAGNININGLCNPGEYVELELTYDWTNGTPPPTLVQTAGIASGGTFPVGTTTNTFEYTDLGGNVVSCSFDVTVVDTEAPEISCIGEPIIEVSGSEAPGSLINSTTTSVISLTEDGTITDLDVDLDIAHTWVSDMNITLESPAGTVVELYDGAVLGCQDDDILATLDDDATDNINDQCNVGAIPTIDGTFAPSAALAAFNGESTMGDWTLTIVDAEPVFDDGTLNSWALNFDIDPIVTGGIDVVLDANGMGSLLASDLITSINDCSATTVTIGGGGGVCNEANPSNGFEDGFVVDPAGGFTIANDLTVDAGLDFELNQVTVNLFHDVGATIASVDVYYFDDAAGAPGTLLGSELGITPSSQTVLGNNFGFDISETVVDITPFNFASDPGADTQYWVAINSSSTSGGGVFWEVTTVSPMGAQTGFSSDGGATWTVVATGEDGVYDFSGTCVSPVSTLAEFDCSQIGENLVEVTVTDAAGNVSTCLATVNVIDDIAPVIECGFVPSLTDSATDAPGSVITDANPTTTSVINVAANESITDLDVDLDISHTWVGDMLITLESPAGTVVELYDGSLLFCGDDDMTVTLDDAATGGNVNDQCGAGTIDGTFTPSSPLAAFNGESTAGDWTLSITDNAGGDDGVLNSWGITYGFNGPAEDVVIELDENGMATIDPFDIISNIEEACGIATAAVDITEVFCSDIGTPLLVTAFVLDNGGNPASCQVNVIVVDNLAPVLTCPAELTVGDNTGNGDHLLGDLIADGTVTVTDNCTDPVTVTTQDPAPGTVLPAGVTTVTMTAEDEFGNVSTCMFDVTVDPTLAIDDQILESGITLFPNPVREQLTVSNTTSIGLEDAKIYDANGRLVQTLNLGDLQGEKTFDVGSLASGIYMVQIQGQGATTVKRLIKQ